MKVVEKDIVISGMLKDEFKRCREMMANLKRSMSNLPKGSLHIRRKLYKGKEYRYHFLKYREDGHSISKHVSSKDVDGIKEQLSLRKRYEKEMTEYKKRMLYLEKILRRKVK